MMKKRTTRIVVNGAILTAAAVIGVTAYQLNKPSREELAPKEVKMETAQAEESEVPMVDAGTDRVKASLEGESSLEEEGLLPKDSLVLEEEIEKETLEETDSVQGTEMNPSTEETGSGEVEASVAAEPKLNFSENTLMEWPVYGNVLLDYNMEQTTYFPTLDQYKLSPAISVQAMEGAPVMAAAGGTVFSIAEDPATGTTVTMELGNGYQAIYGQLKDLTVEQGETVKKGEIIGYIGAPTKYYSTEGSNLYYAMKKNGEPIDPILYLP